MKIFGLLLGFSLVFVAVASDQAVLAEVGTEANETDTVEAEIPAEETRTDPTDASEGANETHTISEASLNETEVPVASDGNETSSVEQDETKEAGNATIADTDREQTSEEKMQEPPVQTGPFIDIFGPTLLSLQMVNETRAQIHPKYTNEALEGKKVVGIYFSADWCGPCRQFTPDLVSFYNKMNARRGKENQFEIVWVSRCRDMDSFGQYFTHMNWLALPPDLAMGQYGQVLSQKYKVKGIPHLALLDEVGNLITTDARNKIPQDKAGIGFPWRNPLATLYVTVLPKSLRLMLKSQVGLVKDKLLGKLKGLLRMKTAA